MSEVSKRSLIVGASITALVVVLCVLVYVLYLAPAGIKARNEADLQVIQADQRAVYTTLDGTEVDLNAYESPVLIVNLWASWSPFTKADHKVLGDLKKQYGDKITIRAVNRII